jgi:hypothetical protein
MIILFGKYDDVLFIFLFKDPVQFQVLKYSQTLSDRFVKLSDVERNTLDILSYLSETEVCLLDLSELVSDLTVTLSNVN